MLYNRIFIVRVTLDNKLIGIVETFMVLDIICVLQAKSELREDIYVYLVFTLKIGILKGN